MNRVEYPVIIEENGLKRFVLFNGTRTKSFYDCQGFDKETGSYPIVDNNNNVVEYMDILGNFTKEPTAFAKAFHRYIRSRDAGVVLKVEPYMFFTTLTNFPARYMTSKKIREIVKNEEMAKYKKACRTMLLSGFVNRIRCKKFLLDVYKEKVQIGKDIALNDGKALENEEYYNL